MTDYEKGTPAWDIGMILTVHDAGMRPGQAVCERVLDLRRTAGSTVSAQSRLWHALSTPCTCGKELISVETSSLRVPRSQWEEQKRLARQKQKAAS